MPTYYMEYRQVVEYPRQQVWNFFSQPANLSLLSPPEAGIKVVAPSKDTRMYPGIIVQLQMGPVWAPKLNWFSEITQIREPDYFIDIQLSGPFANWHHEHRFAALGPNKTEIIDRLHYTPPLGPIGALANWFFIKAQLKRVFTYRQKVTEDFDFSSF